MTDYDVYEDYHESITLESLEGHTQALQTQFFTDCFNGEEVKRWVLDHPAVLQTFLEEYWNDYQDYRRDK